MVQKTSYLDESVVSLNWHDSHCDAPILYNQDACPVYAGMGLNFTCPEGASVHKVGMNTSTSMLTSVSIPVVQLEDAGVYECIFVSGERQAYNVTVNPGTLS